MLLAFWIGIHFSQDIPHLIGYVLPLDPRELPEMDYKDSGESEMANLEVN